MKKEDHHIGNKEMDEQVNVVPQAENQLYVDNEYNDKHTTFSNYASINGPIKGREIIIDHLSMMPGSQGVVKGAGRVVMTTDGFLDYYEMLTQYVNQNGISRTSQSQDEETK